MKNLNSIHFIDQLADMTSYDNREVMARSLLETLNEYHKSKQYWLYQIITTKPKLSLGLLAYSSHKNVVTAEHAMRQDLPDYIQAGVVQSIESSRVSIIRNPTDPHDVYLIYPAHDNAHQIFAVLIERTIAENIEDQRLAHGFLRIYANYIRLLEHNRRDKLTGLLNRETLEQEVTKAIILNNEQIPPGFDENSEVVRNLRQNKGTLKYWLGMVDIDHFKRINDRFGHIYGDEILILVAKLLDSSLRNYDLVFRYGGEEFVILLKAFDRQDAFNTFERIRTTVGHHNYAKVEEVTVSIGFTEIANQSGTAEVIEEADIALYYGKNHGRDQVNFYATLLEQQLITPPKPIELGGVNFF